MTPLFAFDFDGVICDSARETAMTAWRAAMDTWPDRFDRDADAALLARFCACRPVIETGYQNIPLAELLRRGVPEARVLADFDALCARVMTELGATRETLQGAFARARDAWIASDLDGWLAAQAFYPGLVEAINASRHERCIITTKQTRFAVLLCERAGLEVAPGRVFGLEAGAKRDVLLRLLAEAPGREVHFIEDRLATQRALAGVEGLRLYLADWGYNTAAERAEAAARDDIRLVALDEFAGLLKAR